MQHHRALAEAAEIKVIAVEMEETAGNGIIIQLPLLVRAAAAAEEAGMAAVRLAEMVVIMAAELAAVK
jgi:hypothetical protein